jgi:hypothetical protein
MVGAGLFCENVGTETTHAAKQVETESVRTLNAYLILSAIGRYPMDFAATLLLSVLGMGLAFALDGSAD